MIDLLTKDSVDIISVLECQICDLKKDIERAKSWVTVSVIREAIKEREDLLETARSLL